MRKILLITLGFLALLLGGIGILLPVLPTTPFVLCAAGCFSASSSRLYEKLRETRYFGEYIKNYREKTGISPRARRSGLIFLWVTIALSIFFTRNVAMLIIMPVIGIAVSIHIITIKRSR